MTSPGKMWDRRFTEHGWPTDPDPYLVELASPLPAGRALDLGSGPGRNSLWLAARGWDLSLVDASQVGLDQATALAAEGGCHVATVRADLLTWRPRPDSFDLVIVANVHPSLPDLADLLARAAGALGPGGHLYVVGHHLDDLGRHGPPDPDRLLTDDRLASALPAGLAVETLETRDRSAGCGDAEDGTDRVVLAWATRPATPGAG